MTAIQMQAQITGQQAFLAGRMRVPATDPAVASMIREYSGKGEAKTAVTILDAWLHGWDLENLSA